MTVTTTREPVELGPEDRALKSKHRAIWALGDYTAVATEIIADLGPTLVEAVGIQAGDRVLDVAAGAGNVAIPAARTGAEVTASDLTPELLDRGRQQASTAGVTLKWEVGDAEALPYADASFDVVTSCVGVMFAPHHQAAADELVRVCRPGGRIGLISWTPQGFIGEMFATMRPYAPSPPPGVDPPPRWGSPDHVRGLFGDRVADVRTQTRSLRVEAFAQPRDFVDYFTTNYGPTIAVFRAISEDPARVEALHDQLTQLADRFRIATTDGRLVMEWEYLLLTARRVS